MNRTFKAFSAAALAATVSFSALSTAFASPETGHKLLTAHFAPRDVVQVEVGDFHFLPGQVAPIHVHDAPAIGYVAKGKIIYQVEGEKPQILNAGDAFFEPVGPRIMRFDNASATEEAIFVDFNFEQEGEPFIVFENPPTEAIDRRSLPTITITKGSFDQVTVYSRELAPAANAALQNAEPIFGFVAQGVVEVTIDGNGAERLIAGQSFALPDGNSEAIVVNASAEVPAKIITLLLD